MNEERPTKAIEDVFASHVDALMALPGVVGAAVGHDADGPRIRVFLANGSPAVRERVPSQLEGYPVSAEYTGPIRPRPE